MCSSMCVQVNVHMDVVSQMLSIWSFSWDRVSHQSGRTRRSWLANELQRSSCLWPLSIGVTDTGLNVSGVTPNFYMGLRVPTEVHVCTLHQLNHLLRLLARLLLPIACSQFSCWKDKELPLCPLYVPGCIAKSMSSKFSVRYISKYKAEKNWGRYPTLTPDFHVRCSSLPFPCCDKH